MKASNANKVVSVLLTAAMCPMMVPTAAFASEDGAQPGAPATAEQAADVSVEVQDSTELVASDDEVAVQADGTTQADAAESTGGESNGEETAEAAIDLNAFLTKVEESGYNFDGLAKDGTKLQVKWSPQTGCFQGGADSDCWADGAIATGNTPDRVNSKYAQYQLFKGLEQGVTIKNVEFVYTPAAFTICANSGWKGYGTADNLAELQFENKGDVKLLGCSFSGVGIAVFNDIADASTVVHGCSFTNMTEAGGGYAIHYLKGGKINVSGNTFKNVYRGMLVQSTVNKETNIVNNDFSDIDATKSNRYMVKLLNMMDTDIVVSGNVTANNAPVNVNVAYDGEEGGKIAVGDRISGIHTAQDGGNAISVTTGGNQMTGYTAPTTETADVTSISVDAEGNVVSTLPAEAAYAAAVGGKKYETLAEALQEAQAGDTVMLLNDATEDVTISKSITLDLGGKTLTNTNAGKATVSVVSGATAIVKNGTVLGGTSYYNIAVGTEKAPGGNLTLTDVTATAGNTGSSMIDNWGTLAITSGDYSGGLNVIKSEEGSKLNISGGKFTLSYAKKWSYNAVVLVYGDTTITGGEFINNATTTSSYPQVVMTGVVDGYSAITKVTGGTFTNNKSGKDNIFHGLGGATSANFEVSGGRFNKSISEGYCADGFIPTKNADGTYGVKAGSYVAKIGSTGYETLSDAVAAVGNNKTITLVGDVELSSQLQSSKTYTLDLNGFTLSRSGWVINQTSGTLTIVDSSEAGSGRIESSGGAALEMPYNSNAKIVLKSGTVRTYLPLKLENATLVVSGGLIQGTDDQYDTYVVNMDGAALEVTGGVITGANRRVVNATGSSSVLISGGKIENTIKSGLAVVYAKNSTVKVAGGEIKSTGTYGIDIDGTSELTVTDGEFENDTSSVQVEGGTAYIKGGTFKNVNSDQKYLLNCIDTAYRAGTASIEVTGGTFAGFDPSANPEGVGTTYVKNGYASIADDEGNYVVGLKSGWCDIAEYRSSDGYTYPDAPDENKAFAGWYTTDNSDGMSAETALGADVTEGVAYAKWVSADLLNTCFQGQTTATVEDASAKVRLVSTVDTLNYSEVGFTFAVGSYSSSSPTTTVYESIIAGKDGVPYDKSPDEVCPGAGANYFDTVTLRIPKSRYDETLQVQAYWKTFDGTTVLGAQRSDYTTAQIINASNKTN